MEFTKYQEDLQHVTTYIPESGQDRTILITGASGLIGKVLVDACLFYNRFHQDKIYVYAMARDRGKLQERFAGQDSYLELVAQDVIQPVYTKRECDYVIHLASMADPKNYVRYPVETIMTNVGGTAQVLEYARKHGRCRNVVAASTMEVYGEYDEDGESGIKENNYGSIDFHDIRSGYPESKRVAELLCRSYLEEYGVSSSIIRLGYIYGPTMRQDDSKVIAQFIRDIWKESSITMKSAGEQRRTWCYAADAAAAVFHVLFHGIAGEAYNAVNDSEILSIRDVAELAADLSGSKIRIKMPAAEERKGYSRLRHSVLSAEKLRALGWQPKYSFREGLERTIKIIKDGGWYG